MRIEDYIDAFDPPDNWDDTGVHCKYCKCDQLEWCEARGERNQKKWVLLNSDGSVHSCRSGPAEKDEFLDLTKLNSRSSVKPGRRPGKRVRRRIRAASPAARFL